MSETVEINGFKLDPGAVLRGVDLSNADLSGALLADLDLSGANLAGADFSYAVLDSSNLHNADMSDSFLKKSVIVKSDLSEAKLKNATFQDLMIKKSNLSKTKAENIKILNSEIEDSDFIDADLSSAHIFSSYLDNNNLQKASFRGSNIIDAHFMAQNKYGNTDFSGSKIKFSKFTSKNLADSDFTESAIDDSFFGENFGNPIDMRGVKFKGAKLRKVAANTLLELMPEELKDHLSEDIARARASADHRIEIDPRYLGRRTGLWIHMTNLPRINYYGEICVSPYEEGEPIFEERGKYGVVFEGTAPLFSKDVFSIKPKYGFLVPGITPDDWDLPFKEGFLDSQKAKIIKLNVLEGHEDPRVIKMFKNAGIPVHVVVGSETQKNAFSKSVSSKKRARALSYLSPEEAAPRARNPECCLCGGHASLMSERGAVYCKDCF
jgi:uncharacterized protein YjbI with pentapeptide repeats